ncbi:hypothetical protein RvY_16338 [Ramazzottius varieornatus]|uniref:Uncharacterized protein n=1 Tax=Ramazzottius varieornatus TaxID=947166 RepID=A0A1D1VY37_RAMVA|nr:hypothetical protein RvY_16338 [Ramazzottius varieornatus]
MAIDDQVISRGSGITIRTAAPRDVEKLNQLAERLIQYGDAVVLQKYPTFRKMPFPTPLQTITKMSQTKMLSLLSLIAPREAGELQRAQDLKAERIRVLASIRESQPSTSQAATQRHSLSNVYGGVKGKSTLQPVTSPLVVFPAIIPPALLWSLYPPRLQMLPAVAKTWKNMSTWVTYYLTIAILISQSTIAAFVRPVTPFLEVRASPVASRTRQGTIAANALLPAFRAGAAAAAAPGEVCYNWNR